MKMPPAVMMVKLAKHPFFFEKVWDKIRNSDTLYEQVRASVTEIFDIALEHSNTPDINDAIALYLEAIAYMFPDQAKHIPGIVTTCSSNKTEYVGQGIILGYFAILNSPENKFSNPDLERSVLCLFQEERFVHCLFESNISLKGRGVLSNQLAVFIGEAWAMLQNDSRKEWRNIRRKRFLEALIFLEKKVCEYLTLYSSSLTQDHRDHMLIKVLIEESWARIAHTISPSVRFSLLLSLRELPLAEGKT